MKEYYVYLLIDPKDNKPFYVGKGIKERMYYHVYATKKNIIPNGNCHLYNKIRKILNTKLNIKYKKIFISNNEQECYDKEKELIKEIGINNLCNMTYGGEGGIPTEEIRNKLKRKLRGRNNPMSGTSVYKVWIERYGKEKADLKMNIYKEKVSKRMSGQNHPNYGKHLSEELKKKISKTMKDKSNGITYWRGKSRSEETKQKISNSVKLYWKNKLKKA